jgi:signal transduction histidine kinase
MAVLLMEIHRLGADLSPQGEALTRLERMAQLVQDHEATVRDMGLLLRPSMLDDLGLVPALNWQAREVSRRSEMTVTVDADEACNQLSDEYRTCIYRVAQEALQNAARHSGAENVHVTVRQEATQVRVDIQDDGRGFDVRCTKGMGMLGIEERARHLGAVCRFESEPGCGVRVVILLPHTTTISESEADEMSVPAAVLAAWRKAFARGAAPLTRSM